MTAAKGKELNMGGVTGATAPAPGSHGSFGQNAPTSTSPGSAPPGAAGFGGYLPPGITQNIGGSYSASQGFQGGNLAEQVRLYSQKKAREAEAFAAPHRRGVLEVLEARAARAAPPLSQGIGTLSPDPIFATDQEGFLADAQQLSTTAGIPIQQAIISLAASRGLDPNQFLNVAPVGIGSIAPTSTTPSLTAPTSTTPPATTPPATGGMYQTAFPQNVIFDALSSAGVLPST